MSRILEPNNAKTIIDILNFNLSITKEQADLIEELAEKWGTSIILNRYINVSDELYCRIAKFLSNDAILRLFDREFKKDDWVIATVHELDKSVEVFKILKIEKGYAHGDCGNGKFIAVELDKIRHATEEEINKSLYLEKFTPCLVFIDKIGLVVRMADGKGQFYNNKGVVTGRYGMSSKNNKDIIILDKSVCSFRLSI